jgi:hypothetical protein
MSTQENTKLVTFKFKGIELLEFKLNKAKQPLLVENIFNYNINLEQHLNPENRLGIIVVNVDIIHVDGEEKLASMAASCIFEIENFQEFLSEDSKQVFLPDTILTTFNSISISTVRGLLFAQLRGTYLHNAILPIVDPKSFVRTEGQ